MRLTRSEDIDGAYVEIGKPAEIQSSQLLDFRNRRLVQSGGVEGCLLDDGTNQIFLRHQKAQRPGLAVRIDQDGDFPVFQRNLEASVLGVFIPKYRSGEYREPLITTGGSSQQIILDTLPKISFPD